MELMEELKNIKQNHEEQEKQKLEVQQQFSNQLEQMKKVTDEDKHKMEQLMHEKLNEAQQNAEKSIEILKSRVAEREIELSALAAERIQQQAEQSSLVISSLQDQLEKVRSQLQSVESENLKLVQNLDKNKEGTSNSTLTEVGEIMESELQCSICAGLYVSAVTLNCSHTFCKYCITMWKKKKRACPICRAAITSECKSLVLDSFIEKMVQNLTEEMKQKRKDMLRSREENSESMGGPSKQTSESQSAKMLIFLQNGEQRLITFTLPKESCTLQEVLEQCHVPFTADTHIQCMQNYNGEIDYFVAVGSTIRIEELLENHLMAVRNLRRRSSRLSLSVKSSRLNR